MTRDDFPYSLQPYAMPDDGGDGTQACDGWTLVLFRAADEAERLWFRDHGFAMEGRRWVRHAPAPNVEAEAKDAGDAPEDGNPDDQEPDETAHDETAHDETAHDDTAPKAGGPAPDVAA